MRNNKYSDIKIVDFPDKLQSFRDGKITAPIYIRLKPTNRCNHRCHWCVYGDRGAAERLKSHMHGGMNVADEIPDDKLIEIVDDLKSIGVKALTYTGGGEPLVHKAIVPALRRTLYNAIDLSIITNGQLLRGEVAELLAFSKWVRVSMDYVNADQMATFRCVHERFYAAVLDNLRAFVKQKQASCDLGINFIVHQKNCHSLVEFARMMKDIGVIDIRFSPVWVDGFQDYHEAIHRTVQLQLDEIQDKLCDESFSANEKYNIDSTGYSPIRHYDRCYYCQCVPVIGADLNVYDCHNKAYDANGKIGSIADRKFSDLWFSDDAATFFAKLIPKEHCRHQCANDSKNRFIMERLTMSYDNFV